MSLDAVMGTPFLNSGANNYPVFSLLLYKLVLLKFSFMAFGEEFS
jgi:hypothetical protein